MSENQQPKKLNATQRLEVLERQNQEINMYLNGFARDIELIKQAIKLLGNKVDAIQKAALISDDQVAAGMIANNIKELKDKVDGFLKTGNLTSTESVTEKSFVVGKELNDDDSVANERIQFAVGALQPDLKEKLVGSKVGDKVKFSEGTLRLELCEVYDIVVPKSEEVEASTESTEAASEEQAQA